VGVRLVSNPKWIVLPTTDNWYFKKWQNLGVKIITNVVWCRTEQLLKIFLNVLRKPDFQVQGLEDQTHLKGIFLRKVLKIPFLSCLDTIHISSRCTL